MVLKKGFTLVELLVVFTIIVIMAVIIVGLINPIALVNKGYDSQRKKDIKLIGMAFEEYFNDKGCFPKASDYDFNNFTCSGGSFAPWIKKWPCDPNKVQYKIVLDSTNSCPKWYKIFTNLNNKMDVDIPKGWYTIYRDSYFHFGDGSMGVNDYNYGVSSTNIDWYDRVVDASCSYDEYNHSTDSCFNRPGDDPDRCGRSFNAQGRQGCSGTNCFARSDCNDLCQVQCCGAGCD